MKTQTENIMHLEEKHTEYARNSGVFDIVSEDKHAYVITERDDEYGYQVFRGVFYTFDDAFRFACKKISSRWKNFIVYEKWLIVDPCDVELACELDDYRNTNYHITLYDSDGKQVDYVYIWAIENYVGVK